MAFDEQLQQAFDALTERLRGEVARHLNDVAADVAAKARAERQAAVDDVAARSRALVEREADERLHAERTQMEVRLRAETAAVEARVRSEAASASQALEARLRAEAHDSAAEADARFQTEMLAAAAAAESRLRTELATAESRVRAEADDKARQTLAQLERRAKEMVDAAVAASREHVRAVDLAASERLVDSVRALDKARTLTEILDTLVSCAGREVARVGLLLAQPDGLRGWRFIGFGSPIDTSPAITISMDEAGVLAEAVRTGTAAASDTAGPAGAPAFAALPAGRQSVAVPVTMNGDVIAVLYADQGDESDRRPAALTWPDVLELLARHAARCLEGTTAIKAMQALQPQGASARSGSAQPPANNGHEDVEAARRYARLLVSEIKLYHEADVVAGRRERDLAVRLADEIARARALYEQRVAPGVHRHGDFFHDEVVITLANGDASLFADSARQGGASLDTYQRESLP